MSYKRGAATYSDGTPLRGKPKSVPKGARRPKVRSLTLGPKVAVGAPLPSASYNRPPRLV